MLDQREPKGSGLGALVDMVGKVVDGRYLVLLCCRYALRDAR
jgi:hypothetical protein